MALDNTARNGTNENMNGLYEKHTLHSKYSRITGWISFLFLVLNTALQIYSHVGLSAVIKSSIQPGGIGGGGCYSERIGNATDSECVNDPDYSEFLEYWSENGSDGQSNYRFMLGGFGSSPKVFSGCGFSIVMSGNDLSPNTPGYNCMTQSYSFPEYRSGVEVLGYTGPQTCLNCYSISTVCGSSCASQCMANNVSPECLECIDSKGCNEKFSECSGVTIPSVVSTNPPRNLQEIELNVIYEISFISSVRDAFKGGAYGIGIVIVLFSGCWPYAKNLIMFVAWFVPMTWSTRSCILKYMTRLAKWALVDVFAIVIIMAGLRFEKTLADGQPLIILTESRIAIYTFCISSIWHLIQGEWIRVKHLKAYEKCYYEENGNNNVPASCKVLDEVRFSEQKCTNSGKLFLFSFMYVQLVLCITSVCLVVITFELYGAVSSLSGENTFAYSAASIASALLNKEALEYNDSVPGTVFLVVVYVLLSIAIPIFQFCGIIVITFFSGSWSRTKFKFLYEALDIIGGFACQDVFVLSFVVVTTEWDKLISKSVGTMAGESCDGEPYLAMTAQVGIAVYIMTAAFVMGWICEMWFTYVYSQLIHPVEKEPLNNLFFRGVVTSSCCGSPFEDEEGTAK